MSHKTLKKIFDLKLQMFEKNKPIDWSTAESLSDWNIIN